jgi:hypothetical protein
MLQISSPTLAAPDCWFKRRRRGKGYLQPMSYTVSFSKFTQQEDS